MLFSVECREGIAVVISMPLQFFYSRFEVPLKYVVPDCPAVVTHSVKPDIEIGTLPETYYACFL